MAEFPDTPKLLTSGVIAARLGVRIHRVTYLLSSRDIRPTAFAGTLRLYDHTAFEQIERELAAIAEQNSPARQATGPRNLRHDTTSTDGNRQIDDH